LKLIASNTPDQEDLERGKRRTGVKKNEEEEEEDI